VRRVGFGGVGESRCWFCFVALRDVGRIVFLHIFRNDSSTPHLHLNFHFSIGVYLVNEIEALMDGCISYFRIGSYVARRLCHPQVSTTVQITCRK
jgi:hypothetical protein